MLAPLTRKALNMLEGDPALLDAARRTTEVLHDSDVQAAVVGGIAVVLHGYVRTTRDVDVWIDDPVAAGDALRHASFTFHASRKEFLTQGVPVHLVRTEEIGQEPSRFVTIEGVRTVSMGDLISMKLRSGTRSLRRARDLADVVDLIRVRKLGAAFTTKISPDMRPEFRKLIAALKRDAD